MLFLIATFKTNIAITHTTLAGTLGLALSDKRDVRLLLKSTLRLNGQLGSHGCGCICRSRLVLVESRGFGDVAVLLTETLD
jgi:hypothetical protein